jgi:hypothetical protein
MVPSLTAAVLLLAAVWTAYFLVAWLGSLVVRPRPVTPAPPTPDLPPDPPPAVVNYLVHGCRTDAHAAAATLVDLAARRYIELLQPGTDPEQILIRVRERSRHGLAAYEQRVLDRVVETAGPDGAVSLADLSHRYADDGFLWSAQFAKEVAADAKERKLAADGPDGLAVLLVFVGFLLASATALVPVRLVDAVMDPGPDERALAGWITVFMMLFLWIGLLLACIMIISLWYSIPRRTAAGKAATAQWLGVRAWLRAHESFADLPTASVAVWDRYLAYGTALGANPIVSDVVDLGVGDRAVLWSTYTGPRREVRVDYRWRGRIAGYPPRTGIVTYGLLALVVGAGTWFALARWSSDLPQLAVAGIGLLGAAITGWALYLTTRCVMDLFQPVEVTGLVLSRSPLPQFIYLDEMQEIYPSGGTPPFTPHFPSYAERVYYVVVDDGTTDHLPLWTVEPPIIAGDCDEGDVVRLTGHRWCRYALKVTVLRAARKPTSPVRPHPRTPAGRRTRAPRRRRR